MNNSRSPRLARQTVLLVYEGICRRWVLSVDLALLVTAALMFLTGRTVLFFHGIFLLLTIGAFFWELREFAGRAVFWVTVVTFGVSGAVYAGEIQADELVEIPLLSAILVFVFLISRRRAEAQSRLAELLVTEQEHARRLGELAVIKADFNAMVAHELVSPLTALRVQTEMLESGKLVPAERDRTLAAMRNDITALTALASDVQAASRVERDDFTVEPRRTTLGDLLDDAARFAGTLSGEHPLIVEAAVEGRVWVDADRIGQVLRNLLSNAARYSPGGTPITLRVSRAGKPEKPPGNGRVRVEVADEGPGISQEDLPRIFEKFGRGRSGERTAGVGLGLYLSRRILQAHGSELTVRSEPGQGSVFAFELDIMEEEGS